jgi:primosomal protein N' (replication factor Y)
MGAKLAEVVFNLPLRKPLTYAIKEDLLPLIKIGQIVKAPLRQRQATGYLVDFVKTSRIKNLKAIEAIVELEPALDAESFFLAKKISDYYFCSLGQALDAMVPAVLRKMKKPRLLPEEPRETPAPFSHKLNSAQAKALQTILPYLEKQFYQVFLLFGITASGKTEIYLQAIEYLLKKGRTTIMLVPEISLTPQTQERFRQRFGSLVGVWHSRLTEKEKYHEWLRIKEGVVKVVIGTRSAVFAPLKNLGLIILDEEHDTSYKQQESPRYHAREVALMRARFNQACVILGSATPSLESYYLSEKKVYLKLELPERIEKRKLPEVKLIDLRRRSLRRKGESLFSQVLTERIKKTLDKKEQAILFLNRRGFAPFVSCFHCGYVVKCPHCSVSLKFHFAKQKLLCHYCHYEETPQELCPKCQKGYLHYRGIGTQKLESEISRLFPQAGVGRLDSDSAGKRLASQKILSEFQNAQIEVLIGTQMLTKGLDFPKVSLVGVVSADTALNLPDFRASEKTFSLICQVAGRAGRGSSPGEVIVQTYNPAHYAILASVTHDYKKFYDQEIVLRRELNLPPFTHLIKLTLRGRNEQATFAASQKLRQILEKKIAKQEEILGPAPETVARVRNLFRYNLLIKAHQPSAVLKILPGALAEFGRHQKNFLLVDVDPL